MTIASPTSKFAEAVERREIGGPVARDHEVADAAGVGRARVVAGPLLQVVGRHPLDDRVAVLRAEPRNPDDADRVARQRQSARLSVPTRRARTSAPGLPMTGALGEADDAGPADGVGGAGDAHSSASCRFSCDWACSVYSPVNHSS